MIFGWRKRRQEMEERALAALERLANGLAGAQGSLSGIKDALGPSLREEIEALRGELRESREGLGGEVRTLEVAFQERWQEILGGLSRLGQSLEASAGRQESSWKELTGGLSQLGQELSRQGKGQLEIGSHLEAIAEASEKIEEGLEEGLAGIGGLKASLDGRERALKEELWWGLVKELYDLLPVMDGLEEAISSVGSLLPPPPPPPPEPETEPRALPDLLAALLRRVLGTEPHKERAAVPVMLSLKPAAWAEGLKITHRRLSTFLQKMEITPIEAVGSPFDPHLHMAVGVEITEELEENTVVKEERRGYRHGERVIRFAEVVVAKRADNGKG